MYSFGSGVLMGTRSDIAGATPINFGLVNEVDIDVSFTNKMLFGQYKFPLAVGQGTAKVTGKAKMARWSGNAFANLFFGVTPAPGQVGTAIGESATVPAAKTLTTTADSASAATTLTFAPAALAAAGLAVGEAVTGPAGIHAAPNNIATPAPNVTTGVVTISAANGADVPLGSVITFTPAAFTYTVANAASFDTDQGVIYATTGLPLTKVSSAPAQGQYSVNAATGVYTFAAADAGALVLISYTYLIAGAQGQTLSINNTLLGTQPTFQAVFYTSFLNVPFTMKIFNAVSNKLSFGTKLEDFSLPEIDFDIFANPAGNIFELSFADNF